MTLKLLLIDGSNLLMRAAFGGDIPPAKSVPTAAGLIERACRQTEATHLVVALDSPTGSWRHRVYPEYKAHRTRDTRPWLQAGYAEFVRRGWYVAATTDYEADDIIATLAARVATTSNRSVAICSSDSDLLCLTATAGVEFWKPVNGGKFIAVTAADVCAKYQLASPALLPEFKALTGESGDNIPGVPGIGPAHAARLLRTHGSLNGILLAGVEKKCRHSALAHQHEAILTRAYQLVTLSTDAPVPPVHPNECLLPNLP